MNSDNLWLRISSVQNSLTSDGFDMKPDEEFAPSQNLACNSEQEPMWIETIANGFVISFKEKQPSRAAVLLMVQGSSID